MKLKLFRTSVIAFTTLVILGGAAIAEANHSWGGYHWARTTNPFTLKLADNVSPVWDSYLATTSSEWSVSSVLDTTVINGGKDPRKCRPTLGRVDVCNSKYGNNGWLGIAQVWVNGSHITQGTVKMNDSYFNTATYNTPAWKRLVMCQEVGHTFGLDHQDEIFNNANLGTCMDYTNDPSGLVYGQPSNEYPNQHDYDELEAIYAHLDTTNTAKQTTVSKGDWVDMDDSREWGDVVGRTHKGKNTLHERDFGKGEKVFTFVVWVE